MKEGGLSESCPFCGIVRGEDPAFIVRKFELVTVFMDANPVTPGHMLVVPNEHCVDMDDADAPTLAALAQVSREMGALLKDKLGASGYNVLVANGSTAQQSVFHLHFHVVPRYFNDGVDLWFFRHQVTGSGISVRECHAKLLR